MELNGKLHATAALFPAEELPITTKQIKYEIGRPQNGSNTLKSR